MSILRVIGQLHRQPAGCLILGIRKHHRPGAGCPILSGYRTNAYHRGWLSILSGYRTTHRRPGWLSDLLGYQTASVSFVAAFLVVVPKVPQLLY
jgi:hypothetical protein